MVLPTAPVRQRIDKWLFFTRVVKTRGLAARLVTGGHVRINSQRIEAAHRLIGPGDVVTVALERNVRVMRVMGTGLRRGPAPEAATLYEEIGQD